MTDKEKIRSEIERELSAHDNVDHLEAFEVGKAWNRGHRRALENLLSFIDSLPEESSCPKESEDLEEAAEEYERKRQFAPDETEPESIRKAFKAGAEWQREQDKPITGNSLEKEWLRYVNKKKKEYGGELPSLGDYGWLQIARHFAEWQKEQMMKDAVEGEICGRVYDHINVRFANGICKYLEPKNISHIPADVSKYKPGQKVKIIILKDDEYDK